MAMKEQKTETRLAAAQKEIEKLRNKIHNLKRKVKRMEGRKATDRAEKLKAQAERSRRTEEVTSESMDDIKKNVKLNNLVVCKV